MNEQLSAHHEQLDRHDLVTAKLRANVQKLRDELSDKNEHITMLEEEIENLVSGVELCTFRY